MATDFTALPFSGGSSFPVAAGWPERSGIETPQKFSTRVLTLFADIAVTDQITSKDYINEVQAFGDNVYFRVDPDITVHDGTIGGKPVYEMPQAGMRVLPIDKILEWAFKIDDLEADRMDINWVPRWVNRAAVAMKKAMDQRTLAYIPTAAHAANQGITAGIESASVDLGVAGDPFVMTGGATGTTTDKLVECGQVLDEFNVPYEDRFIVIPPCIRTRLMTGALQNASLTGDPRSPLRTGNLGNIDRWTVYQSNLVSRVVTGGHTCYSIPFGWRNATAYASVMDTMETFTHPDFYGKATRGRLAYGRKVMFPEYIGWLYCYAG